jgi:alginate O-acetyltransferase complex protein AlgI
MAFNTFDFFIFWFVFYVLFLGVKNEHPLRVWVLLLANLCFYTLLTGYGVILLLGASAVDFVIAKRLFLLQKDLHKKWFMRLSVGFNISLILLFKHLTDWFHLNQMNSDFHFPIPLAFIGVSFYAFRSMSYVMDVYYETMETPEKNLLHYWSYASFFPIILSGPISQAGAFLERLRLPHWDIAPAQIHRASFYVISGIIKKFIIGNYLAINFIDRVFESASLFSSLEVFLAAVMQTFALYFDFSGYTDIALGLSLFLGFQVSENFNFPFLAQNVSDYWKRWHMSLSQWFNSYVYFPLSYAMRTLKRFGTSIAVFIVFVISGFWHGTAPNFWLWGVMHAICMVWDIYTTQARSRIKQRIPSWIYKPLSIFITFGFLTYSGIYFKAGSIEQGNVMVKILISGISWDLFPAWYDLYSGVFWMALVGIMGHYVMSFAYPSLLSRFENLTLGWSAFLLFVAIVVAYQFERLGSLPFFYLQF